MDGAILMPCSDSTAQIGSTPHLIPLVLLGVLALLGVAVIGFAMWRYRIPARGIAMIGALVYLASPIDVLPEAMLGPLGLLDDAGAVTATGDSRMRA
jgi:uncharacterized protein DUF1232